MNKEIQGHLFACITIILWSATFMITKILLQRFSPGEILVVRFLLAGVIVGAFSWRSLKWTNLKQEGLFLLLSLSGVAVYFLAENYALQYTSACDVGLMDGTIPLWTALGVYGIQKRFSWTFLLSFLIAITGISLILLNGKGLGFNPVGDFLALLSAVSFAVYSLMVKKVNPNIPQGLLLNRIFIYGALLSSPVLFYDAKKDIFIRLMDPASLISILCLACLASGLCYWLWNKACQNIGALRTSVYIYLVPGVNMFFCWIFLKERVTGLMITGGILILLSVFMENFSFLKRLRLNLTKGKFPD